MPDRVVPLRRRRTHSHVPLLLGLLVACVLIGWFLLWTPSPVPLHSREVMPAPPARTVKQQPPPAQPRFRALRPESPPAPRVDSQWEALARTCRYWTQQAMRAGASSSDRAFQQAACERQRSYAAQHGIAWNAPRLSSPPRQSTVARANTVHVIVNECRQYRYGSVDFRKCRAAEKHRLEDQCKLATREWDHARGERRMRLDDMRSAWCTSARRYQIVK